MPVFVQLIIVLAVLFGIVMLAAQPWSLRFWGWLLIGSSVAVISISDAPLWLWAMAIVSFWMTILSAIIDFFEVARGTVAEFKPERPNLHDHGDFWHDHPDNGIYHTHPRDDLSKIIPVDRPIVMPMQRYERN